MSNYYADKLNSLGLFQVYDTALPRVKQYLQAEIAFVRERLKPTDRVLELAAGYGRIMRELAPHCSSILGIDISEDNMELSHEYLKDYANAQVLAMDVHQMTFDESFDVILCLQNGLSATRATTEVIRRALALLAPGGTAYFSTYSADFWPWRLEWFEEQAAKELLGEIDYEQTADGVIVCKDGFRATTPSREDLIELGAKLGYPYEIYEVDGSSLFLAIQA